MRLAQQRTQWSRMLVLFHHETARLHTRRLRACPNGNSLAVGPESSTSTFSPRSHTQRFSGPDGPLRISAKSAWASRVSRNIGLRNDRKEVLPGSGRGANDSAIQRADHTQAGCILAREEETANRRSGS